MLPSCGRREDHQWGKVMAGCLSSVSPTCVVQCHCWRKGDVHKRAFVLRCGTVWLRSDFNLKLMPVLTAELTGRATDNLWGIAVAAVLCTKICLPHYYYYIFHCDKWSVIWRREKVLYFLSEQLSIFFKQIQRVIYMTYLPIRKTTSNY